MKIAYFGSPDFAATLLEQIIIDAELDLEVVLVVTQPDKKAGRKQELTPTPVKNIAKKYDIEIYDRELKNPDLISKLENVELCLVYAYSKIIPEELLKVPRLGFWNIHPSLLPKHRGTSPMAQPLLQGEKKTGVSLMLMDKEMDHGPILAQATFDISDTMNRQDLEKKLTELGYKLFKNTVSNSGSLHPHYQDHSKATYTNKLKKDDGFVSFQQLKEAIEGKEPAHLINLFRALYPWPGIWTKVIINTQERRLKITDVDLTTRNYFIIKRIQLEGKNEVDFQTFNAAYNIF